VHLCDFPVADESLIDEKINSDMQAVREIVNVGLQLRAKSGVKVRQPLGELRIKNCELSGELLEIIKEEVNVKNVARDFVIKVEPSKFILNGGDVNLKLELNTEITPELKLEGQAREIIRYIQEMRKEAGYEVDNRIKVWYNGMAKVFGDEKMKDIIAKETLADEVLSKEEITFEIDLEKEFTIEGEKFIIAIKK
jgi:isoleucyl-tRNA synthetase